MLIRSLTHVLKTIICNLRSSAVVGKVAKTKVINTTLQVFMNDATNRMVALFEIFNLSKVCSACYYSKL